MVNNNKEYITTACNYYNDGILYPHKPKNISTGFVICGYRHHNCIEILAKMYGFPYSEETMKIYKTEVQGFLTSRNRFVDRIKAGKIAINCGQIEKLNYSSKELFSEDLY